MSSSRTSTFTLRPEQRVFLDMEAKRLGLTKSELVRKALDQGLRPAITAIETRRTIYAPVRK